MYKTKLTIQGQRYTITRHDDGSETYDPPLPKAVIKRFAANIKEIAQSGQCPSTPTGFHNNRGSLVQQLGGDEAWAKYITKVARSKGAVITDDHTYISQLAAYPGDPKAFIPPGEGSGYIRKLCEERGKSCQGAVEYDAPQKEPKKKVRLAEDLIVDRMKVYRDQEKVPASTSDVELREMVIEKHGQKAAA